MIVAQSRRFPLYPIRRHLRREFARPRQLHSRMCCAAILNSAVPVRTNNMVTASVAGHRASPMNPLSLVVPLG